MLNPLLTLNPPTGEDTSYLWWIVGVLALGALLLALFFLLGKKK